MNIFMQKSMDINNEWEQLGLLLGRTLIDIMLDNVISVNNYILFSTTRITQEENSRVIGIGFFGNIFFFRDIEKYLNETDKSEEKA